LTPEGGKKRLDRPKNPDIEFTANVKARELRFEEVPENDVRFRSNPENESVWGTERENLPEEVEAGETYRDPRVRLRIATKITDAGLERALKKAEEG
jgi:aminopeptidase N